MQSELHNMSCFCYEATDGWNIRRYLIVTDNKEKALNFIQEFCKKRTDKTEKWIYKESEITDSSYLNAKVIL